MIGETGIPHDAPEYMDPRFHRETVELGWRLPRTEAEVAQAEAELARQPGELPAKLRDLPSLPSMGEDPHRKGSLLSRYLKGDDPTRDARERDRGSERPSPELDR
jgi:hypothetical protein